MTRSPAVRARRAALGPNWFAAVMGTGIVATAAVGLPVHHAVIDVFARFIWLLAASLLLILITVNVRQWIRRPSTARAHLNDPVLSHFYGAPAMALMTVGAGALLVGRDLIGTPAAMAVSMTLWIAGTVLGLWTTVAVPRRMHHTYRGPAFGGWLMPVVPPMVSAAAGGGLVPYLPASLHTPMRLTCWALFAIALAASLPLIALIVRNVATGRLGTAATIPTLFIVVGPLGQSATAAQTLAPHGTFAVAYGVPVLAAAAVWLIVAATLTARTARQDMPFALTWWSFTFPVGTVVTGTSGIAAATGSPVLEVAAVALFLILLTAWVVVTIRTVSGLRSGRLLPLDQLA